MKWDLTVFFKSEQEYHDALKQYEKWEARLEEWKEILTNDISRLEEFEIESEEIAKLGSRIGSYIAKHEDLDTTNMHYKELSLKLQPIGQRISLAGSWYDQLIIKVGKEKIDELISKSPKLQEYKKGFDNLFRLQELVLPEDQERLLTMVSNIPQTDEIFTSLTTADEQESKATLKDGTTVMVSSRNYTKLLSELKDQDDRRVVFETYYQKYDQHKNTLAAIYNSVIQANVASTKIRKQKSVLDLELIGSQIPKQVYFSLIEAAKENAKPVQDFFELKREKLGLSKYYTYDRMTSMFNSDKKYSYETAKELCIKAAAVLGNEWKELFEEVLQDGLVDVYPNKGKVSGAYSSSGPDKNIKPMILMNYNDGLQDVMTLMHEAGHSVHSLLASKAQPLATSGYSIYVAEVASVFAELVLLDYLLENETDATVKNTLLEDFAEKIISTFYRQTLFAEYELKANQIVENDDAITCEVLGDLMADLYKSYYGLDIKKDEPLKQNVWAYIPHHFYSPFYVFQYATCMTISMALYQEYKTNKESAINKWRKIMESGSSKQPDEIVLEAGVNLSDKNTYKAVGQTLADIVEKLRNI